jgi:hypothetical protein
MNVIAIEQLTSLSLLVVFLFGITCGVVGGAVYGSRRGALVVPASDDLLSAGARVIYGVYLRGYDGHPRNMLSGNRRVPGDPRADEGPGSHEQGLDR